MSDFKYSGKLYLIPTTMGAANPMQVLPIQVKEIWKSWIFLSLKMKKLPGDI